jgi:transcriptional regulator with XRE-family HTH domain
MYAPMDRTKFQDWVQSEMDKRGWNQSDLARHANTTRSSINGILTGGKGVGIDLCDSIARAFQIPTETALRAAGFLPQKSENNELVDQILEQVNVLDYEDQEEVLQIARLIRERREKYGVKNARKPSPRTSPSQT